MSAFALRPMQAGDADAVAALHAASWRGAYRGIFRDQFLDHDAAQERRQAWHDRLQHAPAKDFGLVAEDASGRLVGFAYAMPDHDAEWGHYLDNLHVAPDLKGAGLGRQLLRAIVERLPATPPRPLFLWVFDANEAAKRFYAKLGAEFTDQRLDDSFGAERHLAWRCVWRRPATLLESDD